MWFETRLAQIVGMKQFKWFTIGLALDPNQLTVNLFAMCRRGLGLALMVFKHNCKCDCFEAHSVLHSTHMYMHVHIHSRMRQGK